MDERETRSTKRLVLGEHSSITITVVIALLGLAFWTGITYEKVDTLTVQAPAIADAAKVYTDAEVNPLNAKIDDVIARLTRIENAIDRRQH